MMKIYKTKILYKEINYQMNINKYINCDKCFNPIAFNRKCPRIYYAKSNGIFYKVLCVFCIHELEYLERNGYKTEYSEFTCYTYNIYL